MQHWRKTRSFEQAREELDEGVVRLTEERAFLQQRLILQVLGSPARVCPIAERHGWHWRMFIEQDHRILYILSQRGAEMGMEKFKRLKVMRYALKEWGHWEEYWSDQKLVKAICAWPDWFDYRGYERDVKELMAVEHRLAEARRCWKRLVKLIRGDWDEVVVRSIDPEAVERPVRVEITTAREVTDGKEKKGRRARDARDARAGKKWKAPVQATAAPVAVVAR